MRNIQSITFQIGQSRDGHTLSVHQPDGYIAYLYLAPWNWNDSNLDDLLRRVRERIQLLLHVLPCGRGCEPVLAFQEKIYQRQRRYFLRIFAGEGSSFAALGSPESTLQN